MNPQDAIDLGREAIRACLMIGGPILAASLVIGLLMGIFQAMTQVQDQTVSFVPKVLIMMVGIGLALPWLSDQMLDFSKHVLGQPLLLSSVSHDAGGEEFEASPRDRMARRTTAATSSPLFYIPASAQRPQPQSLNARELLDVPADQRLQPATPSNPFQLPHFHYQVEDHADLDG